jgi:hypothetical protein
MAMGDQHYAPVRTEQVVILFEKPARPFIEIGLVSSLGGWFASDGDNYHKMQMAAAALGADAVIVRGQDTQAQRDYCQYAGQSVSSELALILRKTALEADLRGLP